MSYEPKANSQPLQLRCIVFVFVNHSPHFLLCVLSQLCGGLLAVCYWLLAFPVREDRTDRVREGP